MRVIAKLAGILLMLLAFLQWLTFDYPDVNPFWPGAIFASGVISQVFNWVIVCVIGACGFGLFSWGRSNDSSQ